MKTWASRNRESLRVIAWIGLFFGASILFVIALIAAGLPSRLVATGLFVVVWFIHLAVGAGAAYAAWRLWPERENKFAKFTMIHLHAAMIDALGAIVLVFALKGVQFTWIFSIVFFAFTLGRDLVRMPLILYVIRGPRPGEGSQAADRSGEQPIAFWRKEFREAVRAVMKPEFLRDRVDGK